MEEYTQVCAAPAEASGVVSDVDNADNRSEDGKCQCILENSELTFRGDDFCSAGSEADHLQVTQKRSPVAQSAKSQFQASFRDFPKVKATDTDPFFSGEAKAGASQSCQKLKNPKDTHEEFPSDHLFLSEKEYVAETSPLEVEHRKEHSLSENSKTHVKKDESMGLFQCSFKSNRDERENNSQWPSVNPAETNGIDEGLIDQVFSIGYSVISSSQPSSSQCSTQKAFPFEEENLPPCTQLSTNTPNPAPATLENSPNEPLIDPPVASESTSYYSPTPNYSALKVMEATHGPQWANLPTNEIVSSLQNISQVPAEAFTEGIEGAILQNRLSEAVKQAEDKRSWINAFLFAYMSNSEDMSHLIEKYVQANSGEIHPLIHYVLTFDYLRSDPKGIRAYWPNLLKCAVDGKGNTRNLIDKLIRALSLAEMHEEELICAVVCRSLKNHESVPETVIRKGLESFHIRATGREEDPNAPHVAQKTIFSLETSEETRIGSPLCPEPIVRIAAQEDVVLHPPESSYSFSNNMGFIDPIDTPMGGSWWH